MSNDMFQWVAGFMMATFLFYALYRLATMNKGNEFPKDFNIK
jgi:hypothetical protein